MTSDCPDQGAERDRRLRVGDVVCLPGDGVPMTVLDVGLYSGLAYCGWFGPDGRFRQGQFPARALAAGGRRRCPP